MKSVTAIVCSLLALSIFATDCVAAEETVKSKTDAADASQHVSKDVHWRDDPTIRRRPASYIGGAMNYIQVYTWLAENDDHRKLSYGPLHFVAGTFRVGDAFGDKFAIGFQMQSVNAKNEEVQISAFALLLDLSFYPWKGLGVRPSAGFGFGFAQGENKWEFGFGGPGTLSFSLLYEFRITKKMTLAPVVTTTWLTGEGYDAMFALVGIEMLFWLPNKNRYKD